MYGGREPAANGWIDTTAPATPGGRQRHRHLLTSLRYQARMKLFLDQPGDLEMADKIDIYDFGGFAAQTYQETCQCGKVIEVSTQQDTRPEYQTEIYVRCSCGKSVGFLLPVN
jgi:hypothetical protein